MNSMPTMQEMEAVDSLLTVEDVAERLRMSRGLGLGSLQSRKLPYLPVIRMSDGILRYRASQIEEFVKRTGTPLFIAAETPVK